MTCKHCGKTLALVRKLKNRPFCDAAHEKAWHEREELSRFRRPEVSLDADAPPAPLARMLPLPLPPAAGPVSLRPGYGPLINPVVRQPRLSLHLLAALPLQGFLESVSPSSARPLADLARPPVAFRPRGLREPELRAAQPVMPALALRNPRLRSHTSPLPIVLPVPGESL